MEADWLSFFLAQMHARTRSMSDLFSDYAYFNEVDGQ